jgi:hypothetical protein
MQSDNLIAQVEAGRECGLDKNTTISRQKAQLSFLI